MKRDERAARPRDSVKRAAENRHIRYVRLRDRRYAAEPELAVWNRYIFYALGIRPTNERSLVKMLENRRALVFKG